MQTETQQDNTLYDTEAPGGMPTPAETEEAQVQEKNDGEEIIYFRVRN